MAEPATSNHLQTGEDDTEQSELFVWGMDQHGQLGISGKKKC
jgi:hypothetical protein